MDFLSTNSRDLWMWIGIAGLIVVGCLGYFFINNYNENVAPKKKIALDSYEHMMKTLKNTLSGYVRRYEGRVIYSIELASSKKNGSADAILIGWFGVLVLIGCDLMGELYVDDGKTPQITQIVKTERTKRDNPFVKATVAERVVNEMLREKKIYRVQVESAVVFTRSGARLNIPPSLPYYTQKTLNKIMKSNKYIEDKGVDADQVAEAILNWR